MSNFVHLHLHSQYSVLDGAIKIKDLVSQVKADGSQAVAVTDHGTMHGAVEFYQHATAAGIKPIIGCEVYMTPGSRHEKKHRSQGGDPIHHLTLLSENMQGYQNLCRLVTLGYTEGFYFRPRIDHDLMSQFNEGIICLSGCMSGEFASYAIREDYEGAKAIVGKYREMFRDRYYLEVQPHPIDEQRRVNVMARRLGTELGIPLVATNDCHYLKKDDHHAQEVLMCVSMGKLITDDRRIKHDARLHLKTATEMLEELPDYADAVKTSNEVAERCNVSFDFSKHFMPQYDLEEDVSIEDHFVNEVKKGLQRRFKTAEDIGRPIPEKKHKEYHDRLDEEIQLILKMGFTGYFLVVSDFILWAKEHDIPVGPGRGSAAGSLVAWALYITEIDPIPYKLLFERFLNPERVSLPDIDVDFCIHGREKVIDYVCEKYGRDKVSQIVTFGTLKAKAAIKDVGRAIGMSYAETDRIAKLIPAPRQGFDYPIAEAMKMEKKLADYAAGEGRELMSLAQKLEGLTRHTSTHAAGIVIADKPVVEYMPLMVDKDNQVVSQFSMNYVEKIGLVKFDFLGLKTLSVLHKAVQLIKHTTGKEVDLNAIPLDDEKTFRCVSAGRTVGVFQLESSGITEMVSRLKPSCFEDLVAILALYRPGPLDAGMVDHYINRKHKRERVTSLHPILDPILKDTYGIILYQEQIMQIARDMAGYSLGQADMLRRAMGKKKPEEMAKQRKIFMEGALANKVDEKIATEVFDQMETFARYGFNKSHSVAYAMVSYQTAYLKAHYPRQFLAALMSFEMGDTDKTLKNLSDCREMKIKISPPDLNVGEVDFNVVDKKIIFSLAAIKGIGKGVVQKIIEERNENGPFKSLLDLCNRVEAATNRRTLEHFIKAGALDWAGLSRAELVARTEEVIKRAQSNRKEANSNQLGLFAAVQEPETEYIPNRALLDEWPSTIRLSNEREVLGLYLSGHPLEKFRQELRRLGSISIIDLKSHKDGAQVTVAGVITFLKLKNTKKGDRYATFTLEDLQGTIEVIVWPDTYQKIHAVLDSEDPVLVQAKYDGGEERSCLIAKDIVSAIDVRDKNAKSALIRLKESICSERKLQELKQLMGKHQGHCSVTLVFHRPEHSETKVALPRTVSIAPSEDFCNSVEQLFGEPVVSFR